MSAELPLYPGLREKSYKPISFAVSAAPVHSALLAVSDAQRTRQIQVSSSGDRPHLDLQLARPYPLQKSDLWQPPQQPHQEPVLHPYPIARPSQQSAYPVSASPAPSSKAIAKSSKRSKTLLPALTPRHLTQHIGAIKWGTMVLASGLFAATFAAYGWTVALERQGGDLNADLNRLRAHEEGMAGMTTALGASMADEARNPESGLHLPGTGSIFPLDLEPPRPSMVNPADSERPQQMVNNQPRGY